MTVAADYDLWVKLGELGARFANIPEPLVDYRVHPNSLSRKRVGRKRAEARRIRRRQLERLGIDPTRREVRLHDSIAEECVGGIEHLRHSAAWLRRLESANARTGVYPSDAFARLLGQRWYILCRKSLRTAGLHALGAYLWTSVGRRPPLIYLGKTLLWDESGKWRRIYRRSEP